MNTCHIQFLGIHRSDKRGKNPILGVFFAPVILKKLLGKY